MPQTVLRSPSSAAVVTPQQRVLRNTYLMLAFTLVPTVIGALMGMSISVPFMQQGSVVGALVSLAVMLGLFWAISKNQDNGLGVGLLLVLTFYMGFILGPILNFALGMRNGAEVIAMSAGGTAIIFFSLAGVALVTKKDFSFMGKFLFVGLILLIIASLANLFFQVPAVSLTVSAIAILIFSGFILVDVSRIVHGGETNYVMATLGLYLSIYNLFLSLLNILMAFTGQRD